MLPLLWWIKIFINKFTVWAQVIYTTDRLIVYIYLMIQLQPQWLEPQARSIVARAENNRTQFALEWLTLIVNIDVGLI